MKSNCLQCLQQKKKKAVLKSWKMVNNKKGAFCLRYVALLQTLPLLVVFNKRTTAIVMQQWILATMLLSD